MCCGAVGKFQLHEVNIFHLKNSAAITQNYLFFAGCRYAAVHSTRMLLYAVYIHVLNIKFFTNEIISLNLGNIDCIIALIKRISIAVHHTVNGSCIPATFSPVLAVSRTC